MAASLSSQQAQIVRLPAEYRSLVLAGPGTGKTHTLIYRLLYLISEVGLAAGSEILVLSFSRSAVGEIRSRLIRTAGEDAHDDVRFLNARTFDSFATRLLTAAVDDIDLSHSSYDARIELAVRQLEDPGSDAAQLLSEVRHVVVDEIQDLVGVRARLVQRILQRVEGGFTLLGDPAQAIYDYLVKRPEDGPTSLEFLDWVRSMGPNQPREVTLSHNYRVTTAAADVAAAVRPLALERNADGAQMLKALRDVVVALPEAGSVHEPTKEILAPGKQQMAILCRTNAEVLFTASRLNEQGLLCIVPPKVEERGLPAWIGRLFSTYLDLRISKAGFEARWKELIGPDHEPGPLRAWQVLKGLEASERADLDLETLRQRLRHGADWVFDSEAHRATKAILVTTIHQSKGREYDRVAILDPKSTGTKGDHASHVEARVLYVAATRAKEGVYQLDRHGLPMMVKWTHPSGRVRWSSENRKGKHHFQVGVAGDLDDESWVQRRLHGTDAQAQAVQQLIWSGLRPGSQLQVAAKADGGGVQLILVWTSGKNGKVVPLGYLDSECQVDLSTFLRRYTLDGVARYPALMRELIVIERITVVLRPYLQGALYEPYATSGFCLGLNVRGVLRID